MANYRYEDQMPFLMSDEGQILVLKIYRYVLGLLERREVVSMGEIMSLPNVGAFDAWEFMACVDHLVHYGAISEITSLNDIPVKWRVFRSPAP